jgi:hypothetical protein
MTKLLSPLHGGVTTGNMAKDSDDTMELPPNDRNPKYLIVTPTTSRRIMCSSVYEDGQAGGPLTPDSATSSICYSSFERVTPADETFGIESDDFQDALGEIGTHWYGYLWTITLGIVGILDILATTATESNICHFGMCLDEGIIHESSSFCSMCLPFMSWLERRKVGISFVFSLLWFKLAFNKANWAKESASIKSDCEPFKQQSDHIAAKKRRHLDPQSAYILEICTNMLFLPAGFYVIMYRFLHQSLFQGKGLLQAMEDSVKEKIVDTVNANTYGDKDGSTNYVVYTERTTISLIVAIVHHILLTVSAGTVIARARIQKFLRNSAIPILVRKILGKAFRNPRKFRRQLSTALLFFRYIKYSAPIIGCLPKLAGNVSDMLKKWRQHVIAERQKRIRQLLFRNESMPFREEQAAIIVQSTWRARQARRYTYALVLMTQDREAIAAQKIQSILRRKLAESRQRILAKKRELQRLQRQNMRQSQNMKMEDRKRLYELQDEFTKEAKKIINRKLLMRPNTRFAVLWKIMFVLCIGVEISQKALAPLVKNRLSMHSRRTKDDADGMSIRELLAELLIPKRITDRDACKDLTKKSWAQLLHLKQSPLRLDAAVPTNSPWYCHEPYSNWLDSSRDVISLILKPFPVSEWPECEEKPKTVLHRLTGKWRAESTSFHPWYCSKPYASFQTYYRWTVDFFIEEFMVIVSIICFLDVYVTFFTGETDPETGELVPKSFFSRWVIPGLLLQLVLNPAIGPVATFLFSSLQKMYYLGPVRVLRWCIAVVVPIAYTVYTVIMWGLEETDLDDSIVNIYNSIRRSSVIHL